jgi:hypothetical protein
VSTILVLWITPSDVTGGEILLRFEKNHLHSKRTLRLRVPELEFSLKNRRGNSVAAAKK